MEDELLCMVCLETLTLPVTFHCQSHSVCKEPCLRQLFEKQKQKSSTTSSSNSSKTRSKIIEGEKISLSCPICGVGAPPLIATNFQEIEVNKALRRIIALHIRDEPDDEREGDDAETSSSGGEKCEACKHPAVVECLSCGCGLCSYHDGIIHSAGVLMRHPRVPIVHAATSDDSVISSTNKKSSYFCTEHKGRLKEFFCVTDSMFVCSKCLLTGAHTGHSYKGMEEVVPLFKHKMEEDHVVLDQILRSKYGIIQELNTMRANIQSNKQTACDVIESKITELHAVLDLKKVELQSYIENLTREKSHDITSYSDEVTFVIHGLESGVSSIAKLLVMADNTNQDAHSSVVDFVVEAIELDKTVSRFSNSNTTSTPTIQLLTKLSEKFEVDVDIADLAQQISNLRVNHHSDEASSNSSSSSKQFGGWSGIANLVNGEGDVPSSIAPLTPKPVPLLSESKKVSYGTVVPRSPKVTVASVSAALGYPLVYNLPQAPQKKPAHVTLAKDQLVNLRKKVRSLSDTKLSTARHTTTHVSALNLN